MTVTHDGPEIRVMTFNVLNARAGPHAGRWKRRREAALLAVRAFGPDLLGAQEAQDDQADYLRHELREYAFIGGPRRNLFRAGDCVATFYRSERFERIEAGQFWLSETPDVPGTRHWTTFGPRTVCWVRLSDRWHRGKELIFFNTHFDPFSRPARFHAGELLRDRIIRIAGSGPVVVVGDFNASAGRKLYQSVLAGAGGAGLILIDAYRSVHPAKQRGEGTWHGRGLRSNRRIDWILHNSHFRAVEAAIDRAKRSGRYPSDHFPVAATLRWE